LRFEEIALWRKCHVNLGLVFQHIEITGVYIVSELLSLLKGNCYFVIGELKLNCRYCNEEYCILCFEWMMKDIEEDSFKWVFFIKRRVVSIWEVLIVILYLVF
jgi:hypothetical protein